MKYFFHLAAICIGLCIVVTACTEEEETIKSVKPGVYTFGMNLAIEPKASTKGFTNKAFDTNYDYDYIWFHTEDEHIKFDIYDCYGDGTCEGIKYRIAIYDDGSATIWPFTKDDVVDENHSVTLSADEGGYFSSWETNEWTMEDEQIVERTSSDGTNYNFYRRKSDINKEIYRSVQDEDGTQVQTYTIDDLTQNADIILGRGCAGFSVTFGFYDETVINPDQQMYFLTESKFSEYLGDPERWYVKLYVGGNCYTPSFNLMTNENLNEGTEGYYSTGDAGVWEDTGEDPEINPFVKVSECEYTGQYSIHGFGYSSRETNYLLAPVTGGEIEVYALIKYWDREGEPNDEWLLSEDGALQAKIEIAGSSQGVYIPQNGDFYSYGLIIDVQAFRNAWIDAGGVDPLNSTASTRSLSGATVRKLILKDAKVICDVY